jgi:hypothetical protein
LLLQYWVLVCLFFPGASFAKDFSTGLTASFTVQEQEATSVKLLFSLINETTNLYAPIISYCNMNSIIRKYDF